MKKNYFQGWLWRFFYLCLTAAAILFLLGVIQVIMLPQPIGQHKLRVPQPPYIGNPGEVTLIIYCWRKPDKNLLRIEPVPAGLEVSEETLRLTGISLLGFRWQSSKLFWAVEFGEYPLLPLLCGPLKFQLPLQLKILPRPDVSALEVPPELPAPTGKTFPVLLLTAILAMLSDLLLAFWSWNQPHKRALRQLDAFRANAAGCAGLWQIRRQFCKPSALSSFLGTEIRKMQFSPGGLTPARFSQCKGLLAGELRQDPIFNREKTRTGTKKKKGCCFGA